MKKTDYNFRFRDSILGFQFLFVAFGSLVLVPLLTGLNANVALFTAGIGTLSFQLITRGAVPPVFLASSFAFIAAIQGGVAQWGVAETLSGLIAAGCMYALIGFAIKVFGMRFIEKVLPPIVVGPVIMAIGLGLAPVAVHMASGRTGDGAIELFPKTEALTVAFVALGTVLLVSLLFRGWLKLVPIIVGIIAGYITASLFGMVDMTPIKEASWISLPDFTAPKFNLDAILFILPIAIAPAVEHIGDMLAISRITGKNYLEKPGLNKTLLGDGVATVLAGCLGGPPNTTYSEVTGAVTITKAFNPAIMTWAAIVAILFSFVGKLGGILATIPTPVMGGIMLLLFGVIASIGMSTLIRQQVDLTCTRNMAIVAIILVFSIGGMTFDFGGQAFSGVGLGAVVGILLNLVLPQPRTDKNPLH